MDEKTYFLYSFIIQSVIWILLISSLVLGISVAKVKKIRITDMKKLTIRNVIGIIMLAIVVFININRAANFYLYAVLVFVDKLPYFVVYIINYLPWLIYVLTGILLILYIINIVRLCKKYLILKTAVRYCKGCGKAMPIELEFCEDCGTRLREEL